MQNNIYADPVYFIVLYLLDCKPRLKMFYSIISCGLHLRAVYIVFSLSYRKVFSWLHVLSTKLSPHSPFSITCTLHQGGIMMDRKPLVV